MKKIDWIFALIGLVLVLVYLVVFLLKVDLTLVYYWQQIVPISASEALQYPGGFSEMLAGKMLESMADPVKGILAVAIFVLITFMSTRSIFRDLKPGALCLVLMFASLIPLIPLFAHYDFPVGLIMSVLTGLVLTALHGLYSPGKIIPGLAWFLAGGFLIYLLAGPAGLVLLGQAVIIRAILAKKYRHMLFLVSLLLVPLLYLLLDSSYTVKTAYLCSYIISGYNEIPLLFFIWMGTPLLIFIPVLVSKLVTHSFSLRARVVLLILGLGLTGASMVVVSGKHINERERQIYRIVQAAFNEEWDDVLKLAAVEPNLNSLIQFEVNRALFHQGLLLEDLFDFSQPYGELGLFVEGNIKSHLAVHSAALYADMGFANESRHWATEASMALERRPIVLRQLVLSYLGIGNIDMARKYLGVLRESRIHRDWCTEIDYLIEEGKLQDQDVVARFRACDPQEDFFASSKNPPEKILAFYTNNPDNRMAFEYLLAVRLLQHRVGDVLYHVKDFRALGYEQLPRIVEEALLIYFTRRPELRTGDFPYVIDPETEAEFRDFSTLVFKAEGRANKMYAASKYKHTYWYYLLFTSPHAAKK